METKELNWEEEFAKIAQYTNEYSYVHRIPKYDEIKTFISQLRTHAIEQERERIVGLIESQRINNTPYITGRAFYVGAMAGEKNKVHDQTLDRIISLITQK